MSRGRIIVVLAAALCLPVVMVGWLGYRLLEQDSALEKQRVAEGREVRADQAVQALARALAEPGLLTEEPGEGAILAKLPGAPLLFREELDARPEAPGETFHEGELLEFQRGQAGAASEVYRRLAVSADAAVRAGALYRLGRALRTAGQREEALRSYAELARMETASAGGWPAPVAGLWSRCSLFESSGQREELRREARKLQELLHSGRYAMTRAAYSVFADDAVRWGGGNRPVEREHLTDAVLAVAAGVRSGNRSASGRESLLVGSVPVTVAWGKDGSGLSVFAAHPAYIERRWLARIGTGVWLEDGNGVTIGRTGRGQASVRYAAETHLPWTVQVLGAERSEDAEGRRNLLLVLLATVGVFSLVGSYIAVRTLRRELALARMQEDFVAAVSHEFRTPLTTMRQLTESLEEGRVANEEKRASYYRSLSRAAERLHRLVEDLLDFRRMQSGALEYRRAPVNVREFTSEIVSAFRRETAEGGFQLAAGPGPDVEVLADREALGRALWNLLDNAMKYSGESRRVELEAQLRSDRVEWSVRDHGIGIPERERGRVFQQFFRGEGARRAGIRGTGIGLAMVRQIADAHGGRVSVASEEGGGSVFTISIPCEGARCSAS